MAGPMNRPIGNFNRRYIEEMLALAANRDPLKAVELELLFGIRKWIEYVGGLILIGLVLGTIMGYIALSLLTRIAP